MEFLSSPMYRRRFMEICSADGFSFDETASYRMKLHRGAYTSAEKKLSQIVTRRRQRSLPADFFFVTLCIYNMV